MTTLPHFNYYVSIHMSKPRVGKKIDIPDHIMKSLLTPSEMRMLKNRFTIANLLDEGLSVRRIAETVKVGTDTVVRVARMLGKRKTQKLAFKTKTPWIFGKNE